MEAERLWAMLWRFTKGRMTKEEFMRLGDWDMVNVLFRPDKNEDHPERGYFPVRRRFVGDGGLVERDISWRETYFGVKGERLRAMLDAGMTREEAEARFQNWIRSLKHG